MSNHFELPEANEKQTFKAILDSIREQQLKKLSQTEATLELQEAPTVKEPVEEPKITTTVTVTQTEAIEIEVCGREADPTTMEEALPIDSKSVESLNLPEGKKYFRIGEVSDLVGVEAYVLRYWESEFSMIRPTKSSSGHRVYSRKDVETLYTIRQLLHVEKFSIKGAKKKLLEQKKENVKAREAAAPNREALKKLAHELKELIQLARG